MLQPADAFSLPHAPPSPKTAHSLITPSRPRRGTCYQSTKYFPKPKNFSFCDLSLQNLSTHKPRVEKGKVDIFFSPGLIPSISSVRFVQRKNLHSVQRFSSIWTRLRSPYLRSRVTFHRRFRSFGLPTRNLVTDFFFRAPVTPRSAVSLRATATTFRGARRLLSFSVLAFEERYRTFFSLLK